MFVAARQNKPTSAPLFAAVDLDTLLVPAEVVAHEVYAQLSTPLLWRFLREMPARGDDWADSVIGRLTDLCGTHLQSLWKVRLSAAEAPALRGVLAREPLWLGDLLRSPDDRDDHLHAVVLLVARDGDVHLAPPTTSRWTPTGMLLVGAPAARRLLDSTLLIDATREYVLHGRHCRRAGSAAGRRRSAWPTSDRFPVAGSGAGVERGRRGAFPGMASAAAALRHPEGRT
jgi:hypothetical protein